MISASSSLTWWLMFASASPFWAVGLEMKVVPTDLTPHSLCWSITPAWHRNQLTQGALLSFRCQPCLWPLVEEARLAVSRWLWSIQSLPQLLSSGILGPFSRAWAPKDVSFLTVDPCISRKKDGLGMSTPILLTQRKPKAAGNLCLRSTLDQRWMSPGHKHPSSPVSDWHHSGMWQTVSPQLFLEEIQSHFLLLLTSPLHPHPRFSFFLHHICWWITFTGTLWVTLLGSSTWDSDHAQMPTYGPLESLIGEHLAPKVVHRQTDQQIEVAQCKNKYRQFLPWEGWSWVRETAWVITFDVAKTVIEIHRHVPSESRDILVTGNLVYYTLKPCPCPGTLPFPGCLGPTLLLFREFFLQGHEAVLSFPEY